MLYAHVRPCLRKRRGGKTELEARASSGLRTWSRLWQTYTQTERCTRRAAACRMPRRRAAAPPPPRRTTTVLGEHRCTLGNLPNFLNSFFLIVWTFIRHYHFYHLRVFVADHSRFAGLNLLLLQVQYCLHSPTPWLGLIYYT